eukprot:13036706-Alexandrium_andersonii.AAC.1
MSACTLRKGCLGVEANQAIISQLHAASKGHSDMCHRFQPCRKGYECECGVKVASRLKDVQP